MTPSKVVVTGAAGYLGRGIVETLANSGHPVTALVRRDGDRVMGNTRFVTCDLTIREDVLAAIAQAGCEVIIHAAAWIGPSRMDTEPAAQLAALQSNILATAHVAEAALCCGVKRMILCSSAEVYAETPQNAKSHRESDCPHPANLYGRSKLAAETVVGILAGSSCSPLAVRMPGIHGLPRRSGVVAAMIAAAREGKQIEVDEPDTRLSILWHTDAVAGLTRLATQPELFSTQLINLASANVTLAALATTVSDLCGSTAGCVVGRKPGRNRWLDCTLAADILGWSPAPLGEVLMREIQYLPA